MEGAAASGVGWYDEKIRREFFWFGRHAADPLVAGATWLFF